MNWREKKEKEKEKERMAAARKKVATDFWLEFTKTFRSWLHELTFKYKEKGDFPLMACWLLPSYYTEPNDIEVAACAAILINEDEKILEHVSAFRQMFNDKPFEWFKNRRFVALSMGEEQFKCTGGVSNRRIAELFSIIYDNWGNRWYSMSTSFLRFFGENHYWNKLHMLRLILSTSDGIGRGVWRITPDKLRCPLTKDVMALLRTFFPDYKKLGDADTVLRLFGFEYEYDFFYAALAYKDLQGRNPKGCSRLATVFQKRYNDGSLFKPSLWLPGGRDGILPEIDL